MRKSTGSGLRVCDARRDLHESGKPVQQIDVAALTQKLRAQKQVLYKSEPRRVP